jgi:regulator of cell morphogenesis and NO signaling
MLDPRTALADLATSLPAASRVFRRHRLDYCCGGRMSLAEACDRRGLDPATVAAEIESETPARDDVRWDDRPLPQLIDFILTRYHAPLRDELARLVYMARKVERVHGDKPGCPRGLGDHLARVADEVEAHLAKEEQILFPMILSGRGAMTHGPVAVMTREHDDHGASLARTRELTGDLEPPAHACTTWRALYLGLETLEHELMDHIHLENNILFPRALRG